MNAQLFELLTDGAQQDTRGRIFGPVIGVVTDNNDTEGLYRVAVSFPWLGEKVVSWARVAAPMAGDNRGMYFLPEPNDEVLVMFERGDVNFPFVIGALWNGKDKAPVSGSEAENNDTRVIRSRSGHVIKLNDKKDHETIEIADQAGNSIVIDTSKKTVTIKSAQDLKLIATDGAITLEAKTLKLSSTDRTEVSAGKAGMLIKTDGNLEVKGKPIDLN